MNFPFIWHIGGSSAMFERRLRFMILVRFRESETTTAVNPSLRGGWLFLSLQLRPILFDERLDFLGHCEQFRPLFLVQGNRETPETIDRYSTLFADLHRNSGVPPLFECLVFGPQPRKFCLYVLACHLCRVSGALAAHATGMTATLAGVNGIPISAYRSTSAHSGRKARHIGWLNRLGRIVSN
jgi:hypothetical protein